MKTDLSDWVRRKKTLTEEERKEIMLIGIFIALFGIGDTATTIYAIEQLGFTELNTIIQFILGMHIVIFVLSKLLVIIIIIIVLQSFSRNTRIKILTVLVFISFIAVAINTIGIIKYLSD